MATSRDTVRLLCKSIITRLENHQAIAFPPRLRQIVQDDVYNLVGPYIMTDEDIREKALAKMGARAEQLGQSGFDESDQFKMAKSLVRSTLGDDELNGFYFQKPLKLISKMISEYLMRSSNIDDVYESDEELERQVVEIVKGFDVTQLH